MPDITKCDGIDCPFKGSCHRYLVPSNYDRQSYFANPPYNGRTNSCEHYWPTEVPKLL